MRIRIIKDYKAYKKGEIVEVSPNVAFGLTDKHVGVISKDMTENEITTKTKRKKRGNAA